MRGKKLPIPAAQIIRYGVTDLIKYTTNKTLNIIHIIRRVTAYPKLWSAISFSILLRNHRKYRIKSKEESERCPLLERKFTYVIETFKRICTHLFISLVIYAISKS